MQKIFTLKRLCKNWALKSLLFVLTYASAPAVAQPPCRVISDQLSAVTTQNYEIKARALGRKIAQLSHQNENYLFTQQVETILAHSLFNALQHGTADFVSYQGTQAREVPVALRLWLSADHITLQLGNPRIKKFPSSLLREFTPGERVRVPKSEREGFRGSGAAHQMIFDALQKLPPGSSVKWEEHSDHILFSLKVPQH